MVEEIARGWMSVSGVINTHFIVSHMVLHHGTEEQKQHYLSAETWNKIVDRQKHHEQGNADKAAELSKEIKKEAKYNSFVFAWIALVGGTRN